MDISLLVGHHFTDNSRLGSPVYEIIDYDNTIQSVIYQEVGIGQTKFIGYYGFKDKFLKGDFTLIDTFYYLQKQGLVAMDHAYLFDQVEKKSGTNFTIPNIFAPAINSVITSAPNPIKSGKSLLEEMKEATKFMKYKVSWDFAEENKPSCECGGHKVGLKDYQGGHSDWCPVSHTKGTFK